MKQTIYYIYQAETYCKVHGEMTQEHLRQRGKAPAPELEDARMYDSDDYPVAALAEQAETDGPIHCAVCNALIPTTWTSDGIDIVISMMRSWLKAVKVSPEIPKTNGAALDLYADHLKWYGLAKRQRRVLNVFVERFRRRNEEAL